MKLRIGDLVYYELQHPYVQGKGLVTALKARFLCSGTIELLERRADLRFVISRKDITKVVPREELEEWWKYL